MFPSMFDVAFLILWEIGHRKFRHCVLWWCESLWEAGTSWELSIWLIGSYGDAKICEKQIRAESWVCVVDRNGIKDVHHTFLCSVDSLRMKFVLVDWSLGLKEWVLHSFSVNVIISVSRMFVSLGCDLGWLMCAYGIFIGCECLFVMQNIFKKFWWIICFVLII